LHNFDAGQSNILMLASILVGVYYISQKKEMLGGFILGLSIMIKYTPLIFIPYFILRGKMKLGLMILASVALYLLLPALIIGFRTNLSYIKNLFPYLTNSTILDKITLINPKNQSLLSLIQRIFTYCVSYFHAPPMPFQSWNLSEAKINAIFIISAIILYMLVLVGRKKIYHSTDSSLYQSIDYGLLSICVILFNLNAWKPSFILLLMPYFIIIYYLIKRNFRDRVVLTLFVSSCFLNILTNYALFGKALAYKLYFYSPLTISALFIFAALLKIKFYPNLLHTGSEGGC